MAGFCPNQRFWNPLPGSGFRYWFWEVEQRVGAYNSVTAALKLVAICVAFA